MTTTLTYDSTLSRIKIDLSGAPGAADYAKVERSTDGITWTTVRGGDTVPLSAGVGKLYDYEFVGNVLNTYRTSYVDAAAASFVAVGATGSAVNASTAPGLPAGLQLGDVMILHSSIRNSGAGVAVLPAGWTALSGSGTNYLVAGRTWAPGDVAPTCTYTGGVANADTLSAILSFRSVSLPPTSVATPLLNASAQDVLTPAIGYDAGGYSLRSGWKQDDSVGMGISSWTTIMSISQTTGDDASIACVGKLRAATGSEGAQVILWSGGAAAISRGAALTLPKSAYVSRETQAVTPAFTQIWIKNVGRPYLNVAITMIDWSDPEWPDRSGLFPVVGRNYPIAITDVRGGREQTLTATTPTLAAADDLQARFMNGEVVYVHTPGTTAGCPVPSFYALVGKIQQSRPAGRRSTRRYLDIPLVQVQAPVSTIVGLTITWADVVAGYATWADVIAAFPTWADLIDHLASPVDVIVP